MKLLSSKKGIVAAGPQIYFIKKISDPVALNRDYCHAVRNTRVAIPFACALCSRRHTCSRILQASFCTWQARHTAAQARVLRAGMLRHSAYMHALRAMVLGWRSLAAAVLRRCSSILLARHCAHMCLLRAVLHAWLPHRVLNRQAVLAPPSQLPGFASI